VKSNALREKAKQKRKEAEGITEEIKTVEKRLKEF